MTYNVHIVRFEWCSACNQRWTAIGDSVLCVTCEAELWLAIGEINKEIQWPRHMAVIEPLRNLLRSLVRGLSQRARTAVPRRWLCLPSTTATQPTSLRSKEGPL